MFNHAVTEEVHPMRALVVFESMFGNTKEIADAVGAGIGTCMPVDVVEVGTAPACDAGVAFLVVGGPTHAFGLSWPSTRADAATKAGGPVVSSGTGLREWFDTLDLPALRLPAATFATRIRKPRVPGSAAQGAARRLRRLGCHLVVPPLSFWVEDVMGPLSGGELERARRWGEELAILAVPQPGQAVG